MYFEIKEITVISVITGSSSGGSGLLEPLQAFHGCYGSCSDPHHLGPAVLWMSVR